MDISETYIKMCEKAEEVQDLWKPTGGDWYLHDYRGTTRTSLEFERQIWGDSDKIWQKTEIMCYRPSESKDVIVSTDGKESHCVAVADLVKGHSIWLPRQDQLQEMVGVKLPMLEMSFHDFCLDPTTIYVREEKYLTSMEQLWLAFVMKEKYGKIWEGETWR